MTERQMTWYTILVIFAGILSFAAVGYYIGGWPGAGILSMVGAMVGGLFALGVWPLGHESRKIDREFDRISKIKIGSFEDDREALKSDWKAVGDDLKSAMKDLPKY